jgi:hypothetical protein
MSVLSPTDHNDAEAHDVPRKPLGTLLVEAGFIDETQLAEALHDGTQTGERVGEVVVRRGWASEDDVAQLLAAQWELSYVDRASIWFDANALSRLSREDAQQLEALPIRLEGDRVMVAVAEPTEQRLAELGRLIGDDTVVVVVPKSALDAGIRSQLLTSRGPSAEESHVEEEPHADESWTPEPARNEPHMDEPLTPEPARDEPAISEEPEPPVVIEPLVAAVQPEPEPSPPVAAAPLRPVPPSRDGTDLIDLAARARDIADFLAGQAVATREYERRIEELEAELTKSRAAAAEAKTQLAAVLQLVDVLKPSV